MQHVIASCLKNAVRRPAEAGARDHEARQTQYPPYFLSIHSKPSFSIAVPFLPFALANLRAENASLNERPIPMENLIEEFVS